MFHATTIICVRRPDHVAIAGDGQVTLGQAVMKQQACKLRRLYHQQIIAGFAGSTADAMTLFSKFEGALESHQGKLARAAVELAKEWRTDRILRRLEALLLVADKEQTLLISGAGDVLEPDDGVAAIGSGGSYALAAGRALLRHTELSAEAIARESLTLASEICIYTNNNIHVECLI